MIHLMEVVRILVIIHQEAITVRVMLAMDWLLIDMHA